MVTPPAKKLKKILRWGYRDKGYINSDFSHVRVFCEVKCVSFSKKIIKESFLEQLEKKGAKIAVFADLVDDYMSLFDIKTQLKKDIKNRGVTYEDYNSSGNRVMKDNPSVKNLINTNRQMLAIIDKLKLDPNTIIPQDDEDADL